MKKKKRRINPEPSLSITDHAIVRFLERRYKIDMDAIRKAILPDQVRAQFELLGNGRFPIDEELCVVINQGRVVTVRPIKQWSEDKS